MGKRRSAPGRRKDTLGTTAAPSAGLVALMGGATSSSGVSVGHDSALRVSAVYACVRVIAEDLAKLPLQVWRYRRSGGRDPARDHPLHAILRRPNRHMTRNSFITALGAAWGFRGNAIAVILRDPRGEPNGLWPVHPGGCIINEAHDGRLFYQPTRRTLLDQAMLRDQPTLIPDYDVVHVRGLTFDGIVGLSPLAQLREAIGSAIAGEQMAGSLMANGAQPGGVLKHPTTISKDAAERLRANWQQRHGGAANAGRTVLLEEGMSWQALGMTSVDAQFIEQRKLSIEDIARGFRVPLHMIGVLDRMTNNNVEALNRGYYDQTLMPVCEAFEAEIARAFALPDDVFVEFDVRRLLRADFRTRQEGNRTQFMAGALSPNEWREEEGRNPTKGGDVFARPLNTAFVDANGQVVSVTPAGGSDTGEAAERLDKLERERDG